MIEEMKLRNFSPATQQSYVYAVSRLAKYHKQSPDQLGKEDIRAFLVHLLVERKLSPNSLTGYCSGLRFFYNETLGWDENKLFIPPRKKSSALPEVFSPDEVVRLIGAARGLKQRVLLMTAYSAGLRVRELVNLKITDIDAARMTLRVKQGKGGKDRYAILSQKLLTELRQYGKRYRPAIWLFPNRAKNGPLSRGEAWHILPVEYFHRVFTLPHELNGLILTNKKILLSHLFKAVGETLLDFGRTRLGGQIGLITVLHTWDPTLLDHFHLHCLVPAGALSFDQKRWSHGRKNFLFPVRALSVVLRGKFLDLLKKTFDQNQLLFVGQTAPLADPLAFKLLISALRKKPWIVYAKKPFGSPNTVLDYLGRYTHRVALSNDRLLSTHNGKVTFSYRERKNENRKKTMTLDAHEFIRRFLLHVIPKGFVRVRHFGFLANRSKGLLSKCRQLLELAPALPKLPRKPVRELMLLLTGIDITRCPLCQNGTLVFLSKLVVPTPWDSS
jgi:hypothetical protein